MTGKRKQSLYFPGPMLDELRAEAARLDRSLSWIVQRCVRHGLAKLRESPSSTLPDVRPGSDAQGG